MATLLLVHIKTSESHPRRLLTYAQLAEYLNVGVTTAKRLVRDGHIPKVMIAHSVRFDVADVESYIDRQKEQ